MDSAQPPVRSDRVGIPAQRTSPEQGGALPSRPAVPRGRRRRLVLAVVAGALALLCLGGIGVGYVVYDNVTGPDRSSPDVVVDNYLRAYLVERDDVKARLYSCSDTSGLSDLRALRDDLQAREQRFNTTFRVTWGALSVVGRGTTADVAVELRLSATVDGFAQQDLQSWLLQARDEDGWQVCRAARGT